MKRTTPLSVAVTAFAAAVSACATSPATEDSNLPTVADRHKILVAETSERLDVSIDGGLDALPNGAAAELDAFAKLYIRQGHGPIVISAPSGGAHTDSASRMAQAARIRLAAAGVPFAAIAGSTYDASGATNAPLILQFTRYDATAPECTPMWAQNLAHNPSNVAYESFGCSMQSNLAAMISDPRDLLGPRAEDPRDATRRAVVLEAYRKGEQTHADRSDDERVQVSRAVK